MNTFQKFISLYKIDVRSKTEIGVGFLWYHCRATGENATDSRLLLKYYAAAETEAPTLKELEESFANRRNGVVKAAGAHRFRIKQGYERYFNEQFEIPVFESDLPLYIEGRITDAELIAEIDAQSALMIAVATGDASIQDMNEAYRQRRERLQEELSRRGIEDPNPYGDLRRWYGKWSSGDLPSYQSRRTFVAELYDPLIERVQRGSPQIGSGLFEERTGFARVDRGIDGVRRRLETASSEEEYQAVGLLCRETLISLAQAVYDPSQHPTLDCVTPSPTDAKRMLEAYIAVALAGGANEEARRHARAAFDLANNLQHRRTAGFRDAALCAEAAAALVNIIAIVSGRRDPGPRVPEVSAR